MTRLLQILLLGGFLGVMVFASLELPKLGDPNAPIHRKTSAAGTPVAGDYYILNAYKDADTINMVTVVLASYRGFDTLGETIVVFAAGVGCLLLLRKGRAG